jgi:hypothetical protein
MSAWVLNGRPAPLGMAMLRVTCRSAPSAALS